MELVAAVAPHLRCSLYVIRKESSFGLIHLHTCLHSHLLKPHGFSNLSRDMNCIFARTFKKIVLSLQVTWKIGKHIKQSKVKMKEKLPLPVRPPTVISCAVVEAVLPAASLPWGCTYYVLPRYRCLLPFPPWLPVFLPPT